MWRPSSLQFRDSGANSYEFRLFKASNDENIHGVALNETEVPKSGDLYMLQLGIHGFTPGSGQPDDEPLYLTIVKIVNGVGQSPVRSDNFQFTDVPTAPVIVTDLE